MSALENFETETLADIASAGDEGALEAIRVGVLGKKGTLSEKMKMLGKMSQDERAVMGPALNGLKAMVADAITAKREVLQDIAIAERLVKEKVDVTLPVRPSPSEIGRIHPISQVVDEITAIFADMGFSIAEGPDVETD